MLNKRLLLFFFLGLSLLLIETVSAATDVPACGVTISTAGYYSLSANISAAATCLTVNSSNVNIDCQGNAILFDSGAGNGAIGVNVLAGTVFINNVTVQNCVIQDVNSAGTTGYGIMFTRTQNSTVYNNNIQTNGTSSNNAIYLSTGSQNNLIQDNTISAYGTSTGNYGIYLYLQSDLNNVTGNTVVGNGSTTSYALYLYSSDDNVVTNNSFTTISPLSGTTNGHTVYLSTGSSYNTLQGNYIYEIGSATNYAVYLNLNNNLNTITNNTIIANGTGASNYGVYVLGSDYNNVSSNIITVNGTTTNYGIALASSSSGNVVNNNTINATGNGATNEGLYLNVVAQNNFTGNTIGTNGTSTNYGVYLTGSNFNNFFLNNISTFGSSTANNGIYLTLSSYNNFTGNNISAGSLSSGNIGVDLFTSAGYNYVYANTINTNGTSGNHGVYLSTANNNTVISNQIFTNGTSTANDGIFLTTSANKNKILYNNITANGTSANVGISLTTTSDTNQIIGNNILANGSVIAAATTTSNYGIALTTSCYNSDIENNTITTGGGRYNYGISVLLNTNQNTFIGNTVNSGGTGAINSALYNSEGRNNLFQNNVFSTSGSGTDYGIYLTSNAKFNTFIGNNISTFGSTTSYGIYFSATDPNYPHNNTFQGNNMGSIAGADLYFATVGINDTVFINQNIRNYTFTGVGGTINVINATAGEVDFLGPINGTNTSLSGKVYITDNLAVIDSRTKELNKSANIFLYNISTTSTELQILLNGAVCPASVCTNLTSMNAGTVEFNVTQYGNYSIQPASSYPSVDINLPADNYATSNQNIDFNFTTEDDSPGNLNCSLYLNSVLNQTNSSTLNSTLTDFSVVGISPGVYSWYIGCFDSAGNLNTSVSENFSLAIVQPLTILNSPAQSSYINGASSVVLNYTAVDNDLINMTVSLYGDGFLLNNSLNVANGTTLTYNWTGLDLGQHNWTVIAWNGVYNSTEQDYSFNLVNLTINCEAGGPYLENSTVLIQGAVSDNSGLVLLGSQIINISIYNSTGVLVAYTNTTSASNGIFNSIFTGLGVDNYSVNATDYYQGITVNSSNSFIISFGYNVGFIAGNETGYITGFDLGNTSGFNEGNQTGYITGFNLGNISGFTFGNSSGFNFGNETGFTSGYSLGNTTGYALGNETGYILGNATGFTLGNISGFILGNDSGFILGNISGFDIGNTTGFTLGNMTGFIFGNLTGFNFGNQTGYETGYGLGFIAGNETGYITGFDLGNTSGFNEGNQTGYITGFNLGNISGFTFGNSSGFNFGNETGFTSGYSLGNTTGYALGNETGYILGNATGFTLGNISGFILGNDSGFILGNISGFDIGNTTGFTLGNMTGFIFGNLTGFNFGNQTGYETGYGLGFIAGGNSSASLVLDKIATLYNLTNETISYNITLRLTNKGGSNATDVNITDLDYENYNITIGNLYPKDTITISYLYNFTRNSTTYYNLTSIAQAYGIDSLSSAPISTTSDRISLIIPSTGTGQQLIVLKNIYYNNQTSSYVNYSVIVQIINSGGVDLTGIVVTDDDLGLSNIISLNRTQNITYSNYSFLIQKSQDNVEQTFSIARANVNSVIYPSNQISILIPGYGGGPNDISINAPTNISANTPFNATITVKNKNPDIGQDFTLNYWLLSNDETTIYSSGTQTIYVGANDSTNSTTISFLSPSDPGTYRIRANVSGQGVTLQATAFSTIIIPSNVTVGPGNSGGSGGGSSGGTYYGSTPQIINEVQLTPGYTFYLPVNYTLYFSLRNENHSFTVTSISENTATVVIDNNEQTFTLSVGQTQKVDLDRDGFYNISVTLNSIMNNITNFTITKIDEPVPSNNQGNQPHITNMTTSVNKAVPRSVDYLFEIAIILITLVGIALLLRKAVKIKPDRNRLTNAIGKEVYSEDGKKIGKVKEVYLKNRKIYGWLIKPDKKMRKKTVLVKHENVKSIGKIMIVQEKIADHMDKLDSGDSL